MVRIELFGLPQLRAGRSELSVEASTLGEAVAELGRQCPSLEPSVVCDDRLTAGYLIALNGKQLTSNPDQQLSDGDTLVVISAHAGG